MFEVIPDLSGALMTQPCMYYPEPDPSAAHTNVNILPMWNRNVTAVLTKRQDLRFQHVWFGFP